MQFYYQQQTFPAWRKYKMRISMKFRCSANISVSSIIINLYNLKIKNSPNNQTKYLNCFSITNCLFVCFGLTSLLNIWGHIATVPGCNSTLTNVLPHRNTMPQAQDMTPHPVTIYKHGANMSLYYPLMWNVTLLPILMSWVRPDREILPRPSTHTFRTFNSMMLLWW